ncbi:MAG: hypothetical protein ACREIB_08685, partial [Pseudomonadota bacterium]
SCSRTCLGHDMATPPPVDLNPTPVTPQHVDSLEEVTRPDVPVINIEGLAETETTDAPVQGLSPISQAGINLATWVLVILSGFMIVAVAVLLWSESTSLSLAETGYSQLSSPGASTEMATALKELIDRLDAERKAFREFWHEFAQMVLLNLLLPVLTAILGYVFGSREGK